MLKRKLLTTGFAQRTGVKLDYVLGYNHQILLEFFQSTNKLLKRSIMEQKTNVIQKIFRKIVNPAPPIPKSGDFASFMCIPLKCLPRLTMTHVSSWEWRAGPMIIQMLLGPLSSLMPNKKKPKRQFKIFWRKSRKEILSYSHPTWS